MIIAVTYDGSIIRTPVEEFIVQNSKTPGSFNKYYANGVRAIQQASIDDTLLLFTESGICFKVDVKDIPSTTTFNHGVSHHDILSANAPFCSILPSRGLFNSSSTEDYFVVIMTKNYKIMRQNLADYRMLKNGSAVVTLDSDDKVVSVALVKESDVIFNCTNTGKGKLFDVGEVPTTSLKSKSRGRVCYNRNKGGLGIYMSCMDAGADYQDRWLAVSSNGFLIKSMGNELGMVPRNFSGVVTIMLYEADQLLFNSFIDNTEDILLVTKKGMVARLNISSIKEQHRGGVGKKCMTLEGDDKIVACCKVLPKI